uniref:Uncharacterized protein n=1 Tax=Quercus lobata TaxID=97700 RepID=A0A7N2MQM9_QUELO
MVPTGIAIFRAREMGYKSVAHLLMDELQRTNKNCRCSAAELGHKSWRLDVLMTILPWQIWQSSSGTGEVLEDTAFYKSSGAQLVL